MSDESKIEDEDVEAHIDRGVDRGVDRGLDSDDSDIVEAPSSVATRAIDTADRPSARATSTAAATISSRLSPGFGPRAGRPRRPQAEAMLGGSEGSP